MDKTWYMKGAIFLGILCGVLFIILLVYFICRKVTNVFDKQGHIIEEAEDTGLSTENLIKKTVRDKLLEKRDLSFHKTKTVEEYDDSVVDPQDKEQEIRSTLMLIDLDYDEKNNKLSGIIKEISGFEAGEYSHIRFHLKIDGKKKLRFRTPLRPIEDVKVPSRFVLTPVLPRDLTHRVLRIRLYGFHKKFQGLKFTERCLGEVHIDLARYETQLTNGNSTEIDQAVLPISKQFPALSDAEND